jgi:hypothetical protein
MFTVEAMQPLYYEERQKAALQSKIASSASTSATTSATTPVQQSTRSQGPCPRTLAAALNRQQNTTRPTGFLGDTFRTLSGTATPRITTPIKEKTLADMEALIAEKKRDADIVSLLHELFLSHYMQMLTNISVLYAYLVNDRLTMASIVGNDRHRRHLLHRDTFFNALFPRNFFSLN